MTEDQLIADLRATYPGFFARPLREFGEEYRDREGVWTGGEDGLCMPDGLPIFSHFFYGEDTHDGDVHIGFSKWLEARGWYVENYDGATYHIVRLPTAEEIAHWHAAFAIGAAKESSRTAKSPDEDWMPF
jgi:hypothetical protein